MMYKISIAYYTSSWEFYTEEVGDRSRIPYYTSSFLDLFSLLLLVLLLLMRLVSENSWDLWLDKGMLSTFGCSLWSGHIFVVIPENEIWRLNKSTSQHFSCTLWRSLSDDTQQFAELYWTKISANSWDWISDCLVAGRCFMVLNSSSSSTFYCS